MKTIITDVDQLRRASKPLKFLTDIGVDTKEGKEIIASLKELMNSDPSIMALGAPQIGIDARIFCIRFNDTIKTFINPIITKKSGGIIAPETCLNMPGKEILISRPKEITVVYYNDEFNYEDNKLLGAAARVFDQQAQLLDGLVPADLGMVFDIETDGSLMELYDGEKLAKLTKTRRAQAQEIITKLGESYKEFISHKMAALEKNINEDDKLAKTYKSLKLTEDIINGRTVIVDESAEKRIKQAKAAATLSMKANKDMEKAANRAQLNKYLKNKRNRKKGN